ncbi:MAG: hypothetical protein R3E58_18530 [Phycisphaerae bacterium]
MELLAFPVNLIVAPPWTGKTFVTKQLHNHLRTHSGQAGPLAFGQYFHVTIFEAFGMGCEAEPHWWNEWTQIGGSACWIVDGLDEDHRKGHDRALSILERLDALSKERLHELRILFFCRENEVPPKFQTRLVEILEDTRLQQSQLAPMDAAAAREYIASEEKFSHVCQLISANHLQALAAFPVVLNCLMEREPESALNYADILKSVVIELLKDKNREEEATFSLMPLQDRFDAATRIATVLTIGGYDELACDSSLVHNPQLDDVFPSTSQNSRNLRTAAHQSLLSSAFQRTATGYRFRQFHIQEWLTAFELNAYPLARLRPLLVDPFGKPRNDLREVFGLLAAITRDDEVQAWIHEMHGGIPPRSNAAPWTVDHAIKALDRLQAITETTKFGLRFGRTQGLERIAAPGLGDVLKQRIANAELTLAVRELLIDIAIATNARETVETALQLVRSASEDPNLRQSAAILVSRLGTNEELKETGEWIKQIKFQSSTERDIAASLIYAFQDRGIWDYICVRYAPREETRGSFSSTLWYSLESQMSFENAARAACDCGSPKKMGVA